MAIKKLCSQTGCHKVINDDEVYCAKHQKKFEERERERYKKYKRKRLLDENKKKYNDFYNSNDWKRIRDCIISHYVGMDIFEYYTTGKILTGERVHHIIELTDDWNCRLDVDNLIFLTERNHRRVHAAYESSSKNKKAMQNKLFDMINKFNKEFMTNKF